jgi:hypothetical protein
MTISKINYLDEFIQNTMFISNNSKIHILNFWHSLEWKQFLNNLEGEQVYVVTFEFVFSFMYHNDDEPTLILGKPILLTRNSNPRILSDYLKERINIVNESYCLDDTILNSSNTDGPGVIVNYSKINIF